MTPAQGAQYGVINKSSGFGIHKDRRVGILVADGVLYLPIQVGVGTHFLQRQRVFSAGRRGLRDRIQAKHQGWSWDLGHSPGLLHLLNKFISLLVGSVSGTEVSGEKTHRLRQ